LLLHDAIMFQRKQRRALKFLIPCVLLLATPPVGSGAEALATLRSLFEGHLAAIEGERNKELDAQLDGYAREVEQLGAILQRAGDLESWQAATVEATRFARARVLPETSIDGAPERIRALQDRYRGLADQAQRRSATKAKEIASKYLARLGALQAEATRNGDLEQALAYRAEAQRVQALAIVAEKPAPPSSHGVEAAATPPTAEAPASNPPPVPKPVANPDGLMVTQATSAPSVPNMTFKPLVLSPTDRMRVARRLTLQMDIEKRLTLRVGMRSGNNPDTFADAKLLVQVYIRDYGSRTGNIVPALMSTWLVDVPKIEGNLWTFVQLPSASACSPDLLPAECYCSVTRSGGEFYGVVVSVFDANSALIGQAASVAGLASLAPPQFPPDLVNRRALASAQRRLRTAARVSRSRVLPNGRVEYVPSEYSEVYQEVLRLQALVNGG
jgi:hypothetical protein